MRIVRFDHDNKVSWGILKDTEVEVIKGDPYESIGFTGEKLLKEKVKLLAPAEPSKIILAGLNYSDHARELGMSIPAEPVIFIKPPTTVIGPEEKILYPVGVTRVDYEAELAVVIRRTAHNISEAEVPGFILGFTCLNDVTARDLQKKDTQWIRSKSFDTFCPVGPWIETEFDHSNARVRARLNGKAKQDSSTSNFIFNIPKLVSFVSRVMTLMPGDIISTGTPPGIGEMKPGDEIEIEIDGIGKLKNFVS